MAEVKGSMLNAWLAYLNEHHGEGAVAEAIKGLGPEDQARLAVKFLDSSWYPIKTNSSMTRLTVTLAQQPNPSLAIEVGRYMARYVYTHSYRKLIGSDPMTHIEKFTWVDELMHRGLRTLKAEGTGPSSCRVLCRYEPGERPLGGTCGGLEGFFLEVLEMTGGHSVTSSHPACVLLWADLCEFTFEWDVT